MEPAGTPPHRVSYFWELVPGRRYVLTYIGIFARTLVRLQYRSRIMWVTLPAQCVYAFPDHVRSMVNDGHWSYTVIFRGWNATEPIIDFIQNPEPVTQGS